jgi:CMP-N-acetylneuraminic acid synthetase
MKKIGSIDLNMAESASSNILSIITARAGSKRLPNKNILDINGKAVFEYTIDYSKELERILGNLHTIVNTDSNTIIDYCRDNNIDFIYRNQNLAKDDTRIEDVIYSISDIYKYKYISLLYANIPTRYTQEFIKSYEFIKSNQIYDAVMSVELNEHYHPDVMFKYDNNVLERKYTKEYRSQCREKYMIHDGHTILFKSDYFIKYMKERREPLYLYEQFGKHIKPIINKNIVIDIDRECDFKLAEAMIGYEKNKYI